MGLTSAGGHTDQNELLSLCIGDHEDWSAGTGLTQPPPPNACRQLPGKGSIKENQRGHSPWEGPSLPSARPGNVDSRDVARRTAQTGKSKGQSHHRGPRAAQLLARDAAILQSDQGPMEGSPAGRLCGTHSARTGRLWVSRDTANGTDRGWLQARCLRSQGKGGKHLTQ